MLNELKNPCGMQPVEYKILVRPDEVEETDQAFKSAKAVGIVLPNEMTDREKMAQVKGVLIAVGGNAFEDFKEPKPKVGDRVWFAKYAGYKIVGNDEKEYRLCNDKDIAAIVI